MNHAGDRINIEERPRRVLSNQLIINIALKQVQTFNQLKADTAP